MHVRKGAGGGIRGQVLFQPLLLWSVGSASSDSVARAAVAVEGDQMPCTDVVRVVARVVALHRGGNRRRRLREIPEVPQRLAGFIAVGPGRPGRDVRRGVVLVIAGHRERDALEPPPRRIVGPCGVKRREPAALILKVADRKYRRDARQQVRGVQLIAEPDRSHTAGEVRIRRVTGDITRGGDDRVRGARGSHGGPHESRDDDRREKADAPETPSGSSEKPWTMSDVKA